MPRDIEDLLADYEDGIGITQLSKNYRVTKGTIYYHIKIESSRGKIKSPIKYLDHVKNQILLLEEKIDRGEFCDDQLAYVRAEIGRMKHWLKVDRSCLPAEPFVLQ